MLVCSAECSGEEIAENVVKGKWKVDFGNEIKTISLYSTCYYLDLSISFPSALASSFKTCRTEAAWA